LTEVEHIRFPGCRATGPQHPCVPRGAQVNAARRHFLGSCSASRIPKRA